MCGVVGGLRREDHRQRAIPMLPASCLMLFEMPAAAAMSCWVRFLSEKRLSGANVSPMPKPRR